MSVSNLCDRYIWILIFFIFYFLQDISKQGDLILMSQFLIHGENGVIFAVFCSRE